MGTMTLSGPVTSLDGAVAELCGLIDRLDEATDLFERHKLARRLSRAANVVRVLREQNVAPDVSLPVA
jgi:hypothetical protein